MPKMTQSGLRHENVSSKIHNHRTIPPATEILLPIFHNVVIGKTETNYYNGTSDNDENNLRVGLVTFVRKCIIGTCMAS
jgi:hypothetical protein